MAPGCSEEKWRWRWGRCQSGGGGYNKSMGRQRWYDPPPLGAESISCMGASKSRGHPVSSVPPQHGRRARPLPPVPNGGAEKRWGGYRRRRHSPNLRASKADRTGNNRPLRSSSVDFLSPTESEAIQATPARPITSPEPENPPCHHPPRPTSILTVRPARVSSMTIHTASTQMALRIN